jgi:hypothetical protein
VWRDDAAPYLWSDKQFKCRDPGVVQKNTFSDDR